MRIGIAWAEKNEIELNGKRETRWGKRKILHSVVAIK